MSTDTPLPALMPLPQRLTPRPGPPLGAGCGLTPSFPGVRTARLERALGRLRQRSAAVPAAQPPPAQMPPAQMPPVPLIVDCRAPAGPQPRLDDDESYQLTVTGAAVRLTARSEWGVLRGLATLTQLRGGAADAPIGPLHIDDAPRLRWRGLMLDVARHFIPMQDLLRTLDAMELFKLNVLHLHLTDDQGFRFPSRRFARLASAECYRPAELEALVRAASDRGIRVVPELDVPGHATSWLLAYPQWGNRRAEPSRRFGVHQECLDPTSAEVRSAVETLFTELAELFPDECLHMGGDEVHPAWWSEDPGIRDYMRRHGHEDVAALQAGFQRQVVEIIERLGRRAIGWDEVLHPDLPRSAVVQAWRGVTARDRALAAGHDCVLSAPYYLDLYYPADAHYRFDPAAPQHELLEREDALLQDGRFAHAAAGMAWTQQWRSGQVDHLPEHGAGRLLGAEACLWAELVDARVLDVRLWSRMPALAERFWSGAGPSDPADMYRRLETMLARLPGWANVDVPGDVQRLLAAAGVPPQWRPLTDVLEPVKWYGRLLGEEALQARLRGREMPKARPYDADTPLDRVVDALAPESLVVRHLAALCAAEATGDERARAALAELAGRWARLPAADALAELDLLAVRLRALGHAVEQVLGGRADPSATHAALLAAAQPVGEYVLAAARVLAGWIERRPQGSAG